MTMQSDVQTRSPEETRSRILAATRDIFARKGRRGTTTREIADCAGVNEATLFRHFGSKDAILQAVVERYCPAAHIQELVEGLCGEPQADLRRLADALVERMEQVRDLIVMSLADAEADTAVGEAAWRAPMAIRQVVADYMARRVESGDFEGDPVLLARFFMGMIFAHVIARKKWPHDEHQTHEIIDFHLNVFLNGVRKK